MGQLVLEGLALGDVAAVQHDPAHVLVLQQVRVMDLEVEPRAVTVPERALDGARLDLGRARLGEHVREPGPVGVADEVLERRADHLVGAEAEDALDGGAHVGDLTCGVEDGDQVARVGDQRPEPGLALAAMEALGQAGALDGQGDLRGEGLERPAQRRRVARGQHGHEEAARLAANGQRQRHQRPAGCAEAQLGGDAAARAQGRRGDAFPARPAEPRSGFGGERAQRAVAAVGRGHDPELGPLLHDNLDAGTGTGERGDSHHPRLVDLLTARRANERDPRSPQRPLARGRPLLLADQARHARHHEHEQDGRRARHDHDPRVPELLGDPDPGRDQAGAHEQSKP